MSFQVKPDTLASYGSLVERNGINLSLLNVHLAQHANLGSTDGILFNWRGLDDAHLATVVRMRDGVDRGFRAMGGSAAELKRTADYYRAADQRAAAGLDATYPASARPAVDAPNPHRPPVLDGQTGPAYSNAATDVADPLQHLRPPPQPAEFTDPIKFFNVVSDFLSPTWWLNQVLNDTIGVNPLEWATGYVVGDWEGFARCGLVWEDLSKASGAIGDNVKYGLTWLAADWQGRAADAAVHYFDYMRHSLDSHRDVMHRLHEKYLEVARGVWNCARMLADLLKMLLDKAIIAGLAVLAGSLLSWTGVGAGISWAVAGLQCLDILRLWGERTRIISSAQMTIEGFVGFLQSQEAHSLDGIRPVPMPATDYDHPNPEIKSEPAEPRMKGQ